MARLFIGITVPAAVANPLAALVGQVLPTQPGVQGLRVYPPRDLHLTLCFLGEHEGGERLERALVDETRGLAAPELSLSGVGGFPDLDGPRVLWAGVRESPGTEGRLAALRNRALTAALGVGWRRPAADLARPFRPHVTVARVAEGVAFDRAGFAALQPRGTWIAADVVLFESDPARPEERYRPVADAPLAVRPG